MLTDEARDVSTPTAGGPDPESRDEFTSLTQYLTGDEKKDSGSNTGWEYYRDSGNGAEWKKIQPDAIARTGETGRLINNPARPGKIGTRIMFDQSPEVESELMIFQDEPASVIRQCWIRLADDVADGEHQKEVPPTQAKAPRIANRFMRYVAAARAWTAQTGGMFPMLCKPSDEDTIHELSCSRGGGESSDTSVAFNAYTIGAENLFRRIKCPECMNVIKISFWIASQFHGLGGAPDYVMSYHRLETLRKEIEKFTTSVQFQETYWYPMLDHSEQHREMIEKEMSKLHWRGLKKF